MELSDGQLMNRVRGGDRTAFAALVDRHKHALVRYLSRLSGSRDRAEDLAQEAFLRLFQAAHRYEDRGRLGPYLFRIATNLLRSEERRRRSWQVLQSLLAAPNGHVAAPAAQQRALESERHALLKRELGRLPMRYRVPLVLHEVEEWNYGEIARLLGCREGTVKSRIFRSKRKLREALAPYVNGGGP